jgi:type IV pilus assembly protein PilC
MPTFTYTARDVKGQMQQATIEAPNRDEVMSQLRKQKLQVIKVDEGTAEKKKRSGAIKMRDIVIFTRQFSTMINAGLPLVQALSILSEQSENPALKDITKQVVYDVESGNTLADALRKHPKAFNELYVNMVSAGEAGGILDTILLRLAVFIEKNDALARKVKGAMIYPGVIFSVAGVAISALLFFVIPTFEKMFKEAGVPLPFPTQVVIGMSAFLQAYWWALGLGGFIGSRVFKTWHATPAGTMAVDKLMLRLPVLGDVVRKSAVSRFTRTLGTLISSGVSILEGLEITAKTSGNRVIHDAIMESRASIAGGDTISAPLKKSAVFPPMVISMINVGEQTGGLDEMLTKIADFYDDEVDAAVGGLMAMMEPMMIVFLGIVVGGMVVAMYLPIFDMVSTAG